jgi:hypothetical protein
VLIRLRAFRGRMALELTIYNRQAQTRKGTFEVAVDRTGMNCPALAGCKRYA